MVKRELKRLKWCDNTTLSFITGPHGDESDFDLYVVLFHYVTQITRISLTHTIRESLENQCSNVHLSITTVLLNNIVREAVKRPTLSNTTHSKTGTALKFCRA